MKHPTDKADRALIAVALALAIIFALAVTFGVPRI